MSEKKKKVGRPRKYESRSERQKAYHERKKLKVQALEEKVKQLEDEKIFSPEISLESFDNVKFKETSQINWTKVTPGEIALMGTKDLEILVKEFRSRINQHPTFENSLENITLAIVSKNNLQTAENISTEKITQIEQQITKNARNIEERMQQQTLLYLMEAEVANRQRLDGRKSRLDLFEAKVEELEKEVKEKSVKVKKEAQ